MVKKASPASAPPGLLAGPPLAPTSPLRPPGGSGGGAAPMVSRLRAKVGFAATPDASLWVSERQLSEQLQILLTRREPEGLSLRRARRDPFS